MSATVAVSRQVDGLRDRPREERLGRGHHVDVAGVGDRPLADRHVEHRQVLVLQAGRADDRVLLGDVGVDLFDLGLRVAERLQRQRHRAVDDRHRAAADQLLELDQREVRLDPGRVAVHQEADRPGRREHRRLRVAVAVLLAELDRFVPGALRRVEQVALDPGAVDLVGGVAVHPHDPVVAVAVLLVLVVGTGRRLRRSAPTGGRRGRSSAR